MPASNRLLEALASAVGQGAVIDGARGRCTTGSRRSVLATVFPSDTAQVAAVLGIALSQRVPVYPVSTGRNWGYGTANPVVDGCIVVNLSRMNRIVDGPDPVTGLVTLEPGVTQGQLADFLEQRNLPFLVPTTGAGPLASVVGNALERGYGITPVSDHFGAVVGLEAILADGTLYRSPFLALGGAPGLRSGIGPYLDGLFSQSGAGIVTRMTIALAPRPEALRAFLFNVRSDGGLEETVSAVQAILARLPGVVGGINVMNAHRVLAMSVPYPAERLGSERLIPPALLREMTARHGIAPWTVFGTLYGTRRTVAAAQRDIRSLLPSQARRVLFIGADAAQRLSRLVARIPLLRARLGRRLAMLASGLALVSGKPNETALSLAYWRLQRPERGTPLDPAEDGCGLIWYAPVVEMKPSSVRRYADMVRAVMTERGFEPLITLSSLSDRCFGSTVPVLFDPASLHGAEEARACHRALLEAGARSGFIPYRVDVDSMAWLTSRAPEHWQIVAKLKHALDPHGLIAPGRYAPAP